MSATVDTAVQQQPSRFFDLPAELREMADREILLDRTSCTYLDLLRSEKTKPALLRTCRALRAEGMHVLHTDRISVLNAADLLALNDPFRSLQTLTCLRGVRHSKLHFEVDTLMLSSQGYTAHIIEALAIILKNISSVESSNVFVCGMLGRGECIDEAIMRLEDLNLRSIKVEYCRHSMSFGGYRSTDEHHRANVRGGGTSVRDLCLPLCLHLALVGRVEALRCHGSDE